MTITQLTYVLALNKHKNFTKAAKGCMVSQPSLSMQIQKLEEELKVSLFDRTKKPIETTKIAKENLWLKQEILQEMRELLAIQCSSMSRIIRKIRRLYNQNAAK